MVDYDEDEEPFEGFPDDVLVDTEFVMLDGVYTPVWRWLGLNWDAVTETHYGLPPMPTPPGMIEVPQPWQSKAAAQVHWLCLSKFRGALVGDEAGVGKTLLALLVLDAVRDEPGLCLIVAPKSVCIQWMQDIERAYKPGHGPKAMWLQDSHTSFEAVLKNDIIVVSYEALDASYRAKRTFQQNVQSYATAVQAGTPLPPKPKRPMSVLHSALWKELVFERVILDEVQKINKRYGSRHQAVKAIPTKSTVGLSGTLPHIKFDDLEGCIDFIGNHPIKDKTDFLRLFGTQDEDGRQIEPDESRIRRLQKFLQPFTIVRPSSMPSSPELVRCMIRFKATPTEVQVFDSLWKKYLRAQHKSQKRAASKDGSGAAIRLAIKAQLRSLHELAFDESFKKQRKRSHRDRIYGFGEDWGNVARTRIPGSRASYSDKNEDVDTDDELNADDPAASSEPIEHTDPTLFDREAANIGHSMSRGSWLGLIKERRETLIEDSTRLETLHGVYGMIRSKQPEAKILIFSEYLSFLDIVAETFSTRTDCPAVFRFDGTLSYDSKEQGRKNFDKAAAGSVMLVTAGAGGVGLNTTTASAVILTEIMWNTDTEEQALSRAYRPGQSRVVSAYRLQASNSLLDIAMLKTHDAKRGVNSVFMRPLVRPSNTGFQRIELLEDVGDE